MAKTIDQVCCSRKELAEKILNILQEEGKTFEDIAEEISNLSKTFPSHNLDCELGLVISSILIDCEYNFGGKPIETFQNQIKLLQDYLEKNDIG